MSEKTPQRQDRILLAHGSGGRISHELIEKLFLPRLRNPVLEVLDDSAVLELGARLAFTTDSYVVSPLFWNGGDIGKLAVCGTVNDLSMTGARPLYLSAAFVIEEGFPIADLETIVDSMRRTADEAGVSIATGDTKVVERGSADGLFINTAGLGLIPQGIHISGRNAKPGAAVIVSGPIGDHGIAVVSRREGLEFGTDLKSDVAPLNGLVAAMLESGSHVYTLRDPTRGGLATVLNEIASQSKVAIYIDEDKVPVRAEVKAACEMLGYDPLYVANEGKLVAVVAAEDADKVLAAMRRTRYGEEAVIIGEMAEQPAGMVLMRTAMGGTRVVNMLAGELLPRIC